MNNDLKQKFRNYLFREAVKNTRQIECDLEHQSGDKMMTVTTSEPEKKIRIPCKPFLTETLRAPFDEASELSLVKAKLLDGSDAMRYAIVSEAQADTGELNLSTIMGICFGINYYSRPMHNPLHPPPLLHNNTCCHLAKVISFQPFDYPVWVRVITKGTLPDDPVKVTLINRGEPQIRTVGVEANLFSTASFLHSGNRIYGRSSRTRIIKSEDNQGQLTEFYHQQVKQDCWIFIPPGLSEIVYAAYLFGSAYTSFDVLPHLGHVEQFAFGMLDLRNQTRHQQYGIFHNPYVDHWKDPWGGLKIRLSLEFYRCRPDLV